MSKPAQLIPVRVEGAAKDDIQGRTVDSTFEARASLTPELVVALCGPIGSPLHETAVQITNVLREFGYLTEQIRMSDLIRLNVDSVGMELDRTSRRAEINSLIATGDELRRKHGNDVLAKMAIAKISADRRKSYGEFSDRANEGEVESGRQIRSHRICHVVDSIKNIDELRLFRSVYGDALFSIGVFSPVEVRTMNLEHGSSLSRKEIGELIDTDSGEEFDHGQSVRDTFPQCDFFLRLDDPVTGAAQNKGRAIAQLVEKLSRIFNLIFRTEVVSPTPEENAMYAAASAARNSACMSRQVGAAVTSKVGELLATGWNDVPGAGGGVYGKLPLFQMQTAPREDHRCYAQAKGACHNDLEKRVIAQKLVEALDKGAVLKRGKQKVAIETILKDTRVKDLIEFSRAVHAEMHAILGASRVAGDRVIEGKVFVTTYPCHSCARHLVAAGIAEIYYIEPYRKSLATRLHSDALTEAINGQGVKLMQFDGVAPRRFIDLFEAGSRKSGDGVLMLSPKREAAPSTHVSLRAIPRLEEVVVAEITSKGIRLPKLTSGEGGGDDKDSPVPA